MRRWRTGRDKRPDEYATFRAAHSDSANETVTPSHNSASCKDPSTLVAGDLRISPTALADERPALQAPDSAPLKPLALPVQGANGQAPTAIPDWFSPADDSPPDLLIAICNTSTTKSHVIESVSVKLSAFAQHRGSLNVWNPCDGTYARPAGVVSLECGERPAIWDETVRASFAANAQVGAIVPASLDNSAFVGDLGPLPVTLPPGRDLQIGIFVTAPTASGVYTFAAGITADERRAAVHRRAEHAARANWTSLDWESVPLTDDAGRNPGESTRRDLLHLPRELSRASLLFVRGYSLAAASAWRRMCSSCRPFLSVPSPTVAQVGRAITTSRPRSSISVS